MANVQKSVILIIYLGQLPNSQGVLSLVCQTRSRMIYELGLLPEVCTKCSIPANLGVWPLVFHFCKIAPEDMLLYALLVYCSSWTVHLQKAH